MGPWVVQFDFTKKRKQCNGKLPSLASLLARSWTNSHRLPCCRRLALSRRFDGHGRNASTAVELRIFCEAQSSLSMTGNQTASPKTGTGRQPPPMGKADSSCLASLARRNDKGLGQLPPLTAKTATGLKACSAEADSSCLAALARRNDKGLGQLPPPNRKDRNRPEGPLRGSRFLLPRFARASE
jgi:hypothetical protein